MSNREYTNLRKYTNNIKGAFLLLLVVGFIALPFLTLAVSIDTGLDATAGGADLAKTDVAVFVGNVIKAVLALLGVIVLIFMVYGGYLWMMSGGNDQMVKKSKDILINATIGLIIVLAAYAITAFVVGGIYSASVSSGSTTDACPADHSCMNETDDGSSCVPASDCSSPKKCCIPINNGG